MLLKHYRQFVFKIFIFRLKQQFLFLFIQQHIKVCTHVAIFTWRHQGAREAPDFRRKRPGLREKAVQQQMMNQRLVGMNFSIVKNTWQC